MAEYLLNSESIHRGLYEGNGLYSRSWLGESYGPAAFTIPRERAGGDTLVLRGPLPELMPHAVGEESVQDYEEGDTAGLRQARLSPAQLVAILRRCSEIGYIGEQRVFEFERQRLQEAGREDLAEKVRWISQESVAEGYDVLSFEEDGNERWIEVKATVGHRSIFEMTHNEWQTAAAAGRKYCIYRVTNVESDEPAIEIIRDPCAFEEEGSIEKTPLTWRVEIL